MYRPHTPLHEILTTKAMLSLCRSMRQRESGAGVKRRDEGEINEACGRLQENGVAWNILKWDREMREAVEDEEAKRTRDDK